MSKMAAVDAAIRLQLATDGHELKLTEKLNAKYTDKEALQRFLIGVAHRLKLDEPSLRFDWSNVDPQANLTSSLLILECLIEEKTETAEAR